MIYLDNACTSFPKAKGMSDAIKNYIDNVGVNVNRSSYSLSFDAMNIVYETRVMLKNMFDAPSPKSVIFTKNITESLNAVLHGLFNNKENNKKKFGYETVHILTSSLEHNSVMRPLNELQEKNLITYTRIPANNEGIMDVHSIENLINENTKAFVIQHASNVCGIINDLEFIGDICKKHNLLLIVDAAQTAGVLDISMKKINIDILCFTGHKSLLGPQGIGGFILNDGIDKILDPFIVGGTGSFSDMETQPNILPDKYESGTLNLVGIVGLNASLKYINEIGIENIRKKEFELTKYFLEKLIELEEKGIIKIIGPKNMNNRLGVISITSTKKDNALLSNELSEKYNILTRVGLHCAPNAHKTLGTFPEGSIRFSVGYFNTKDEIDETITFI